MSGHLDQELIGKTVLTHSGSAERCMDGVFVAMCLACVPIALFGKNDQDENTSGDGDGDSDGGGKDHALVALLTIVFVLVLASMTLLRISKHVLAVDSTQVIHRRYRCLGFVQAGTTTHMLSDLGTLVLDTKRSWWGILGFYGVYATKGVPYHGQSIQVAFEIKMFWQNPFCDQHYRGTYFTIFRQLGDACGFQHVPVEGSGQEQTTTITYIGGGPGWANVADGYKANLSDVMNSFQNYLAVNPTHVDEGTEFDMRSSGTRSVFFCHGKRAARPRREHAAAPSLAPAPAPEPAPTPGAIRDDAATRANVEAIRLYHHLRNSKEEARLNHFVETTFAADYRSFVKSTGKHYDKSTVPAAIRSGWQKNWNHQNLTIRSANAESAEYSYTIGRHTARVVVRFREPGVFASATYG